MMSSDPINIEQLSEGGRGIKLMWQLSDELHYTRTPAAGNCLLIGKSYPPDFLVESQKTYKTKIVEWMTEPLFGWHWLKSKRKKQEAGEPLLKQINLQVRTELSALEKVLHWYEQLKHLPIPQEVWWKCQIALAEGFTNAVRHAHKNLPSETPICLEIKVFKKTFRNKNLGCGSTFRSRKSAAAISTGS